MSSATIPETYYVYVYRKSLGKKHRGKEFTFGDSDSEMRKLWLKIRALIDDLDICEIRVTDTDDYLNIHWTEESGILYPELSPEAKSILRRKRT